MNYDHAFHAGNFADVVKHVVLVRILLYLQRKPAPYRVIDTHAGAGLYDLAGEAAARTAEWRGGIGRLAADDLSPAARDLAHAYVEIVGAARGGTSPYPGSPLIALRLARPADRLLFCELHPKTLARLRSAVGRDRRAKIIPLDGYTGLKAFIPPVERRGLVLIDPPFEVPDEFDRLGAAVVEAHAKWPSGIFMIWYPIKDRPRIARFLTCLARAGLRDALRIELELTPPSPDARLAGSGLVVVNPPYTLEEEMTCLMPELGRQLGSAASAWRVARLSGG